MKLRCRPRAGRLAFAHQGVLIAACITLLLTGCSGDKPENEWAVFPAAGIVTFRGKPIPDATVVLHPTTPPDNSKPFYTPRGVVGDDGSFQLTTYRSGDGAPPGEYRVTVSWLGPLDGLDEDQIDRLRERLPRRYTNPQTSGLSVTIGDGPNDLSEITIQ